MKTKSEVRKRLSEVRTEIRKLNRKAGTAAGISAEAYEVLDQLIGARDELVWVLELEKCSCH